MSEPTMDVLVRRLDRVERENRRWQWIATITIAVIGAVLLVGQAPPRKIAKVLEAERFVLRDADGTSRAELGMLEGASILLLNDEDGMPGVALSVVPNGPRKVSLLDKNGKTRSVLTARADGDSGLRLFDKNRAHRASLDVMADGRAILRLANQGARKPVERRVGPDHLTMLEFTHPAALASAAWQEPVAARSHWLVLDGKAPMN